MGIKVLFCEVHGGQRTMANMEFVTIAEAQAACNDFVTRFADHSAYMWNGINWTEYRSV